MKRKRTVFYLIITFLLLLMSFSFVRADDDDERDDEDDVSVVIQSQIQTPTPDPAPAVKPATSKPKTKTYTQVIEVEPARIVTENQTRIISLPDSDRDGLNDAEDPHPEIAEIYVVKDDNSNGIVDSFERAE